MDSSIGQMAELAKLLQRYRSQLLVMIQRRIDPQLTPQIDAEDVLYEAFIEAKRRYTAFSKEPHQEPYPWLYQIALDCLRKIWNCEASGHRDDQEVMPWPTESVLHLESLIVGDATSPSQAADRQEHVLRIQEVLQQLAAEEQEILWMRHFDQLTHKEVSEILQIKESTATLRYVRALRRMRQLWKESYGGELPK